MDIKQHSKRRRNLHFLAYYKVMSPEFTEILLQWLEFFWKDGKKQLDLIWGRKFQKSIVVERDTESWSHRVLWEIFLLLEELWSWFWVNIVDPGPNCVLFCQINWCTFSFLHFVLLIVRSFLSSQMIRRVIPLSNYSYILEYLLKDNGILFPKIPWCQSSGFHIFLCFTLGSTLLIMPVLGMELSIHNWLNKNKTKQNAVCLSILA